MSVFINWVIWCDVIVLLLSGEWVSVIFNPKTWIKYFCNMLLFKRWILQIFATIHNFLTFWLRKIYSLTHQFDMCPNHILPDEEVWTTFYRQSSALPVFLESFLHSTWPSRYSFLLLTAAFGAACPIFPI